MDKYSIGKTALSQFLLHAYAYINSVYMYFKLAIRIYTCGHIRVETTSVVLTWMIHWLIDVDPLFQEMAQT